MIKQGDALDLMREMPDDSIDAIVTDPPYGLEFMGKDWDSFHASPLRGKLNGEAAEARAFGAFCEAWGEQALRVLKPGGHLLAFGGTRTFHRLAVALEDVGFDIRDCLM